MKKNEPSAEELAKREAELLDQCRPDHPRLKSDNGFEWTTDQLRVLYAVIRGESVFFTGSAGTGKSALEWHISHRMFAGQPGVYVTATTGIAATLIDGCTLHSFAGIGLGKGSFDEILRQIRYRHDVVERWKSCKTLIIDEISMLNGDIFDMIERIAREIRAQPLYGVQPINAPPFGGIQVIACGDFLQLPPVKADTFAFESNSWSTVFPEERQIELTRVFRQSDDMFVSMLNEFRFGRVSNETIAVLEKRCTKENPFANLKDGIEPTRLHAHKKHVHEDNERELAKLPGDAMVFRAHNTGADNDSFPVGSNIELKIGAQVMLMYNMDVSQGLCNGARGVVVGFQAGFDDIKHFPYIPIVRFAPRREKEPVEIVIEPHDWSIMMGTRVVARRRQIPLQLAWSMTIHKSQGATLDRAELNLSECFECGQVYVALSRLKSLDGAWIKSFSKNAIRTNPQAVEFHDSLAQRKQLIMNILEDYMAKVLTVIVCDY